MAHHHQVLSSIVGTYKTSTNISRPDGESTEIFTEYTFSPDGTYTMSGYPPVEENGKWQVIEKVGNEWRVKFHGRLQKTMKKKEPVQWNPAEVVVTMRIGADSLTWENKVYHLHNGKTVVKPKKKDDDSDFSD